MKVAILGRGNVGQALATGLKAKHQVRFGSRSASKDSPVPGVSVGSQKEAATWADVVILAVPYGSIKDTVQGVGSDALTGKVLVDATNAIGDRGLAVGFDTSGAEDLQKIVPGARVVKAFNTVFAGLMATGKVGGESILLPIAGDDDAAKKAVLGLARDIGFDPVDAGSLRSARNLEPLAMQMIHWAYGPQKMGPTIALKLIRAK